MTTELKMRIKLLLSKEDNTFYEESIRPLLARFKVTEKNRMHASDIRDIAAALLDIDERLLDAATGGGADGELVKELLEEIEKAVAKADEASAKAGEAVDEAETARSLADRTAMELAKVKTGVGEPSALAEDMGANNVVSAINWLYDNRGTGSGGGATLIPGDVARMAHVNAALAEAKAYTDDAVEGLGNAINVQAGQVRDITNNLDYTKKLAESNKAAIEKGLQGYKTITENAGGTDIAIYKEIEGNSYSSGAMFTYDTVTLSNGCSNRNHSGYTNEMTLNGEGIYVSTSGVYDIQAKGGFMVNNKSVATDDDVDAVKATIGDLESVDNSVKGGSVVASINNVYNYAKNTASAASNVKTFGKIYGGNNVAIEATTGGKEVSIVGTTLFGTKTTATTDSIVVEGVAIAEGMQCGMMSIADKKKLDSINVTSLSIGANGVLTINGVEYQLTPVSGGETQEPTIVRQYAETPVVIVSYPKAPAGGGIIDKGVLNYYQNYVTVWSNGKTETERRTSGAVVTYSFEPSGDFSEGAENGTVLVRANETSSERIVGVMTVTVTMDGVSGEAKVTIRQAAAEAVKEIYYGSIGDGSGNMTLAEARALAEDETPVSLKSKLTATANTTFSGSWNRTAFFVMVKKGTYSNIVINSVSSIGTTTYSTAKGNIRKSPNSDSNYDIYYAVFTGATDTNNPTANVTIS